MHAHRPGGAAFREKLWAQYRALSQVEQADRLCVDIAEGRGRSVLEARCQGLDPAVFTKLCRWRNGLAVDCALSLAAQYMPRLAQKMLELGADLRSSDLGSASILYSAALGAFLAGSGDRELFGALLARGADPAEPVAWGVENVEDPYDQSLLAYLIGKGEAGGPFIERLYESPEYDGLVWPSAGAPLTAEEFARAVGQEALLPELAGLRRWSRERRAWIGAVLRAFVAKHHP